MQRCAGPCWHFRHCWRLILPSAAPKNAQKGESEEEIQARSDAWLAESGLTHDYFEMPADTAIMLSRIDPVVGLARFRLKVGEGVET